MFAEALLHSSAHTTMASMPPEVSSQRISGWVVMMHLVFHALVRRWDRPVEMLMPPPAGVYRTLAVV
jgi:hypothetical protein